MTTRPVAERPAVRGLCRVVRGLRRAERGSGSVLGLGIIGALLAVTALLLPLLAVFAVGQAVRTAADAAALAAADTASGLVAGVPCQAAAAAAELGGAAVTECAVDGLIASVAVARTVLGFDLGSRSRAGPPPPSSR